MSGYFPMERTPVCATCAGQKAARLAKQREEQQKKFLEAKEAIKKSAEGGLKDMSTRALVC